MSDWTAVAVVIVGMLLAIAIVVKWIKAKAKIERIFKEEIGENDDKNGPEDR